MTACSASSPTREKALEAYERKLTCADTKFDGWTHGDVQLTATEETGAAAFVSNKCINCHSGVAFSDSQFHNLGLGTTADTGRQAGAPLLLADPMNGAGAYSDDTAFGAARLQTVASETATLGAFRTPSLRGVGQRPRFGHLGAFTDLAIVSFLHTLDCPAPDPALLAH